MYWVSDISHCPCLLPFVNLSLTAYAESPVSEVHHNGIVTPNRTSVPAVCRYSQPIENHSAQPVSTRVTEGSVMDLMMG